MTAVDGQEFLAADFLHQYMVEAPCIPFIATTLKFLPLSSLRVTHFSDVSTLQPVLFPDTHSYLIVLLWFKFDNVCLL